MKLGVIFPQTEIGDDAGAIREFAQTSEELGYEHILAYDHVLGADPAKHPDWGGLYTMESTFHEPFVLFGYLAAVTSTIKLDHRHHHPAAAADGPRRQAGRRRRRAQQRPYAPRRRSRLEPRGVRGPRPGLPQPWPPSGRAGRPVAQAVDRRIRRLLRTMAHGQRRGPQPHARAAAHPYLDGWRRRPGAPSRCRARRRLAPAGPDGRRWPPAHSEDV